MKKALLVLASLFVISAPVHAQQFWVGSVFDDSQGGFVGNIQNFDWASSGSGLVKGVVDPSTGQVILKPGDNFDFLYQSYLFALMDPAGQSVSFPGLNTKFEYTVVARLPETVFSVTPVNGTTNITLFKTLPGGQFFIYHDGTPNADVPTGLGFDDGELVAQGTIDADQFSSFTSTSSTGQGIGSAILMGSVTYANPKFLDPAITISKFRFEGTINYPPLDSTTTSFFASRVGEGNLDTYPVASTDLLLKVDGSNKFIETEVPPTACRVTAGGVEKRGSVSTTLACQTDPVTGLPDPTTCAVQNTVKKIQKTTVGFKDTWGGQAGASGIAGNWTHHHDVSPSRSFLFHSNTVNDIVCSDCLNPPCTPAGANATCRQIDFTGIGRITNQKGFSFPTGDLCYKVHLEDIGEPGGLPGSSKNCTHCPGSQINNATDCGNCADYYEIKIFGNTTCTGNPIYVNGAPPDSTLCPGNTFQGYFITDGNVQMHP